MDSEDYCPKCEKVIELTDRIHDFRTEPYIESKPEKGSDEPNVQDIIIFKRTFKFEDSDNIEEKMEELVNKRVKIDYNIDSDERSIAWYS